MLARVVPQRELAQQPSSLAASTSRSDGRSTTQHSSLRQRAQPQLHDAATAALPSNWSGASTSGRGRNPTNRQKCMVAMTFNSPTVPAPGHDLPPNPSSKLLLLAWGKVLGEGNFGQVVECHDFSANRNVAVKIIQDDERSYQQALIELQVLQYLREHDQRDEYNIVQVLDHFTFRNHLCIMFEPLAMTLLDMLKQDGFEGLAMPVVRTMAQQVLQCLEFIGSHDIMHCDLKPENIMLRHPSAHRPYPAFKVIDFGSACLSSSIVTDGLEYHYIQSRYYRAPEAILGLPVGTPVDMWSFGCILAEAYTGRPLFDGDDEAEQLQCIMEVLGVPSRELLEVATRTQSFFDADMNPIITVNSRGQVHSPGASSLQQRLKCDDPAFVDLLQQCLTWDPAQRITPLEALTHPWVVGPTAPSLGLCDRLRAVQRPKWAV